MVDFILEHNAPNKNILYVEINAFNKRTVYLLTDDALTSLMVLCKEYYTNNLRSAKQ
jgi:hypothetical protein